MKPLTLLLLPVFAACATVAASPAASRNGVLADDRGMTLYTFKKDTTNTSNCYDGCAKAWPPFVAPADASPRGDFSLVRRKDGTQQWAYKTMPLYYYAGDAAPGEMAGDGSGKVWFAVRNPAPGGSAVAAPAGGAHH